MKEVAYVNGVEVDVSFAEVYHIIKSKVALSVKLNPKERAFYLLYVANDKERTEFLKNEKD